jgi:hypothetical protein
MHPTIPLNLESESHATTGTTSSLEISHTSTAVNINMESTKLCRHWTNRFDIGSVNFPPCELCIHGDRDTDIEVSYCIVSSYKAGLM